MPKINEIQMRDPFVLREGDTYYLYGSTDKDIWRSTGTGFDCYRSTGGLEEFEGPFPAFRPPADFWSDKNFWAPEVYKWQGAYYMFATFLPREGRRGTAILKSEAPMGPFVPWSDGAVTPKGWECLDGTLYVDEKENSWMVFCHEWQQVGDGEICLMPLSENLQSAIGEPALLFRASEAPWAKPLANRPAGSYVTDGPFFYRAKNGDLLLLWSSFGDGGYCIGAATSQSGQVVGPWKQWENPIYESDGGHGMLFTGKDGTLYLAIHTPNDSPNERPVFLPLKEQDGILSCKQE